MIRKMQQQNQREQHVLHQPPRRGQRKVTTLGWCCCFAGAALKLVPLSWQEQSSIWHRAAQAAATPEMRRNGRKMPIRHALFVRSFYGFAPFRRPCWQRQPVIRRNPNHQHPRHPWSATPSGSDCVICGMQRASIPLACNKLPRGAGWSHMGRHWRCAVRGGYANLKTFFNCTSLPFSRI